MISRAVNMAEFLITKYSIKDSFYIADMGKLQEKIAQWNTYLPDIKPHYAIKCNNDKEMLKTMVRCGMGFDVASKGEIDIALDAGCDVSNMVYANPMKKMTELLYAEEKGVKLTTVDSICEVDKLVGLKMKALLRLGIDNPSARVQLGNKYGVKGDGYKKVLEYAKSKNVDITGVCFHVGSASKDPMIFKTAIDYSRQVLDYGKMKGFKMNTLDIGGGFTGENFIQCAEAIKESIKNIQEIDDNMIIIAEPGRYFAESCYTFCTPIIGKKSCEETNDGRVSYWINDGLYGSFNCIIYDSQVPVYEYVRIASAGDGNANGMDSCTVYGSTCDSFDCLGQAMLPGDLEVGDFLVFPNFGAYTLAGACDFNCIQMSKVVTFYI